MGGGVAAGRSRRGGAKRPQQKYITTNDHEGGSVAEWLACWTQAQKGPCSNRSRDAVG